MAEQIRIRALLQGDIADIRVLMPHAMETGQRKDEEGQIIVAHYIQTFTVNINGKALIDGQLNTSISKNPLFGFKARGLKAGDKLTVAWVDSKGDKRQDEIILG